jgi:hypothetical protein
MRCSRFDRDKCECVAGVRMRRCHFAWVNWWIKLFLETQKITLRRVQQNRESTAYNVYICVYIYMAHVARRKIHFLLYH